MQPETLNRSIQPTPTVHPRGFTPNLQEGVYQVEALHGSVGRASATPSGGAANDLMMFTILDDGDVETGNWITPVLP